MAVPFSLSDGKVAVKHMTKWAKSKTELKEGAVVLSVNGERCHGADDARRMLRDTCADKSAKLVLQVWRPPEDFVHGEGGGEGAGTGEVRETEGDGGADDERIDQCQDGREEERGQGPGRGRGRSCIGS